MRFLLFIFLGLFFFILGLYGLEPCNFYQNDLNCFKDPTCNFLHWGLSLIDININISSFAIFFS